MTDIKWCETPADGECIPGSEWGKMAEYIKHSAVTDFTIYATEGTCVDTGQAFRFTKAGVTSKIIAGANVGDGIEIWANEAEAFPFFKMPSNGVTNLRNHVNSGFQVANDFLIFGLNHVRMYDNNVSTWDFERTGIDAVIRVGCDGDFNLVTQYANRGFQFISVATDIARISYAANVTTFEGGAVTGDNAIFKANNVDTWPYMLLDGDDFALINVASYVEFQDQNEQMFKFEHSTPTSYLYGSDDAGDDLYILANEAEDCSAIALFGNAGIRNQIKNDTGIFEVSTCSDERLFDIFATNGDKHVDFHCLDANNFVLENRTSDPVSPCTGQMWFRTDLV